MRGHNRLRNTALSIKTAVNHRCARVSPGPRQSTCNKLTVARAAPPTTEDDLPRKLPEIPR